MSESAARQRLQRIKRCVIKIGSALLTDDGRGLDSRAIARWVEQIAVLRSAGVEVLLVSSGAVAAGMRRLNLAERPRELHGLQAAAAVGQMGLAQTWEALFQEHGLRTAQILLTHDDLSNRKRYLNARSTLHTLLDWDVIPVINENDTVVTDEFRFGDNDTLAALVANLVTADMLIILTDQLGLFDSDPRVNPDAKLISEGRAEDPALDAMAGGSAGALGRGGMATKLRAARLAARSGAATVIVGGRQDDVIGRLHRGESLGTLLSPKYGPQAARKQWLAGHLQAKGRLVLDAGAVRVLRDSGRSLLAVGVRSVEGRFQRGEMVLCIDEQGRIVARGLVNYDAAEAAQIIGRPSSEIADILGYAGDEELIHRDNLALA